VKGGGRDPSFNREGLVSARGLGVVFQRRHIHLERKNRKNHRGGTCCAYRGCPYNTYRRLGVDVKDPAPEHTRAKR